MVPVAPSPLTKVKLINELNAREAELGVQEAVSWHAEYKDSAWVFVGGLPYELTEGDIICVFSQYGEVVNINLVRDKKTGKSKGFCFLCYEDQRSTILAVDNFNGIKIKGRTIRVDHVANYRPPKDSDDLDDVTKALREKGCGVKTPPHTSSDSLSEDDSVPVKKKKDKEKSRQEQQKQSLHAGKRAVSAEELHPRIKIKKEKEDPAYDQYANVNQQSWNGSERKYVSRTQREEEEQRHQRASERRREKSCQEQRGQNSLRKERGETGRKGEGRSSRREECLEGTRSRDHRESSAREPHSRHREPSTTRNSSHH
ncbi:RNA-binding motif protein, X-linked 2 isoform X1 [Rhea pennata]|uniref:RNA-binding motif protein, X-linked 2 isoform X1 n=1 Tax=Rhea pennata TaxID=8795 RepID=UPI002E259B7F